MSTTSVGCDNTPHPTGRASAMLSATMKALTHKMILCSTVVLIALTGCSGEDSDHHGTATDAGVPTQSTCPSTQTLTYDNFGKGFFESYCLRCHSSKVVGDARAGAPTDHNFDTVGDARTVAEHIDKLAAAGPGGTNTSMPPAGSAPSEAERRKLGEWLACGAP